MHALYLINTRDSLSHLYTASLKLRSIAEVVVKYKYNCKNIVSHHSFNKGPAADQLINKPTDKQRGQFLPVYTLKYGLEKVYTQLYMLLHNSW